VARDNRPSVLSLSCGEGVFALDHFPANHPLKSASIAFQISYYRVDQLGVDVLERVGIDTCA
jgi:hypothetical protein